MYYTTAKNIVAAKRYFELNPDGKINTGMWQFGTWDKEHFYRWFRRCLHLKTGGRELTEKDGMLMMDARIIKEYMRGIKRSGANILCHPKMKSRFPHIDNPQLEIAELNQNRIAI